MGSVRRRIAAQGQPAQEIRGLIIAVDRVREGKADYGFNARTEEYENLLAAGVIDPTKVTRVALENAASIASMLLTTECVISEEKEEKAAAHSHGGGMGDMGGMM